MNNTIKRFSDIAKDDIMLVGEKMKMENVIDKEIEIIAFAVINSKYTKLCTKIQFVYENKTYFVFTGSSIITGQLEKHKDDLPFLATIAKMDRCLTLT
ncbi:MAG: hypothetical protein MJ197_07735 [Bacteroidales bacterium]|nr:hypothetical protein [Bacteroidales bacterium]